MEEKKVVYADGLKFDFIVNNDDESTRRLCKYYNGYIIKGDVTEVYVVNAKTDIVIEDFLISTIDVNVVRQLVWYISYFNKYKSIYHSSHNITLTLGKHILQPDDNCIAYRINNTICDYTRNNICVKTRSDSRFNENLTRRSRIHSTIDICGKTLPTGIVMNKEPDGTIKYSVSARHKNSNINKIFSAATCGTLDKALERAKKFLKLGFNITDDQYIEFETGIKLDENVLRYDVNAHNIRLYMKSKNNPNTVDVYIFTSRLNKYVLHFDIAYLDIITKLKVTVQFNTFIRATAVDNKNCRIGLCATLKPYGLKTKLIKIGENEYNLGITPIKK